MHRNQKYIKGLKQLYSGEELNFIQPEFTMTLKHVYIVYAVAVILSVVYFLLQTPPAAIFFLSMALLYHIYVWYYTRQKFEIKGDLFIDGKTGKTYNLKSDLLQVGGKLSITSYYGAQSANNMLKLYFSDKTTFEIRSTNLKNFFKIQHKLLLYQT